MIRRGTVAGPRVALVGMTGTALVHAALAVALFVLARPSTPPRATYAVRLTAAPAPTATRRLAPEAVPRPTPPPPAPPPKSPPPKRTATPPPPATKTPAKPTEPAPPTANPATPAPGETPSTGTDVATIDLKGQAFPFPEYLQNIVNQILRYWDRPSSAAPLRVDVSFTILRDGTVKDIMITRSSRNYAFDLGARGAVEAAANASAFGPLPAGYESDILPITFFFKPRTTP